MEKYEKNCINIGKTVFVIESDGSYEAFACGIDDNGELIVIKDGIKKAVFSGEVSVRGVY